MHSRGYKLDHHPWRQLDIISKKWKTHILEQRSSMNLAYDKHICMGAKSFIAALFVTAKGDQLKTY